MNPLLFLDGWELGAAILAPAVVAGGIAFALRRLLRQEARERWEAALAIAFGYAAGYLLMPSLAEIRPTRNWHWTLYLVLAAGIVGPLCAVPRMPALFRWLLGAAVLLASAALLTPSWNDLRPPRPFCIPLLFAYLLTLVAVAQPLATRVHPVMLLGAVAATLFTITLIIASAVALVNAKVALAGFGAAAGYTVILWRSPDPPRPIGFGVVYAVLAGGWAFFGAVQPKPAEWALLLAPLAPAMLWLGVYPPLSQLTGKAWFVAQAALVLLVLAVSVAIVEGT